jgi:hypothetical protein
MLNDYQILKEKIKNFTNNERFSYSDFSGEEVIAVHLSAPSIVRKNFTLNKIQNLISKHNLNLKVFEKPEMVMTDRFVISKI